MAGRPATILTDEQRAEVRDLRSLGYTWSQARYRVLTSEQRARHLNQCAASHARMSARNPRKWMLDRVAISARRRGIEFTITEADLEWPTHCPIMGWPLQYATRVDRVTGTRAGGRRDSAAVDRIDNARGYVPGNVVIVSYWVNLRKGDATVVDLQSIASFYSSLR